MDNKEIRTFIANKGYCTLNEIRSEFSDNDEILQINLNFLLERNRIRKIKYQSPNGPGELYYILAEK